MTILTPDAYASYDAQRVRVQQKVQARGRGSQTDASYDLRIPPTRISQLLSGYLVDPALLNTLEQWVDYVPGAKADTGAKQ